LAEHADRAARSATLERRDRRVRGSDDAAAAVGVSSTGCAGTCTSSTRSGNLGAVYGGPKHLAAIAERLAGSSGLVARLSRALVEHCHELTYHIFELDRELEGLVARLAPSLLAVCGRATLTAAKIVGETADVTRFRSRHAYARHNGTAPVPA
jgi:transposase